MNTNKNNEISTNTINKNIPKQIFIVPYRNRMQQKFFFSKYMTFILEDFVDYEIYFSHQCDNRHFNRGGTKNIGFLAMKNKYPNDYKDITFIFNDVDTIPFNKIFDYDTTEGIIKHYYGFTYALGGIVVIKGSDFEKINGYPNFWGWGNEDNCLQKRSEQHGLKIDRSHFYPIGSPQILQLFDGISRIVSKKDPWRMKYDNGNDGLSSIQNLNYTIDSVSKNPKDNIYIIDNEQIYYININTFTTNLNHDSDDYYSYDLREPPRKVIQPNKLQKTNKTFFNTNEWSIIPTNDLNNKTESNKQDIYNDNIQMINHIKQMEYEFKTQMQQPSPSELNKNKITQEEKYKILKEHQLKQKQNFEKQFIHPQQNINKQHIIYKNNVMQKQPPPNIYSPEYAYYIGEKSRATPSAVINLGGVKK